MIYRITLFLSLICLLCTVQIQSQMMTPDEFLPHKVGEKFTPHHYLYSYFKHVESHSDMIKIVEYGKTNQERKLFIAIISTPETIDKIEDYRLNHLRSLGMANGVHSPEMDKSIVWLGYSVHGNEAAGSESSYKVLYDLVGPNNEEAKRWLKNSIVIMDPSQNPDGYSRWTQWINDVGANIPNTNEDDIEHNEQWATGRTNHYFFDLNRDWAWLTQLESQQRVKMYNEWLPHVVADIHEMGHNSPYYFAPAAKPYHKEITPWQRQFQKTIGKNHASHFDNKGWAYFTHEVFDLFYPSYGDTYPTFNGAIGMTYEQGASGHSIKINNGKTLALSDRIAHHIETSLSTIEVSSQYTDELVSNMKTFYNTKTDDVSYILKNGSNTIQLQSLLDKHKIQYNHFGNTQKLKGWSYRDMQAKNFIAEDGDLIVTTNQPKGRLVKVLFDYRNVLEDSLTYDITAWALPYAFNLEAYAIDQILKVPPTRQVTKPSKKSALSNAYAYWIPRNQSRFPSKMARLVNEGIKIRVASQASSFDDKNIVQGDLLILKADNTKDLEKYFSEGSNQQLEMVGLKSGLANQGPDLGSNKMKLVRQPKILLLRGDGVNNHAFGEVRYFLESTLAFPFTTVDVSYFKKVDINKYNTIILPNGRYDISSEQGDMIYKWIKNGGRLIALESAASSLKNLSGFTVDQKTISKAEKSTIGSKFHYNKKEREQIEYYAPGSIVQQKVDNSHPIGYGLGTTYFSLKTNSITFDTNDKLQHIFYYDKKIKSLGFTGHRVLANLKESTALAVQSIGSGECVYASDNPLFRAFWIAGQGYFNNMLFLDY